VLIVVANPTTATTVGWPVGFWGAELTHPYYERAPDRGGGSEPQRGQGRDGRPQRPPRSVQVVRLRI
jgi:hypothetical protein